MMSDQTPAHTTAQQLRAKALSRWESDDGVQNQPDPKPNTDPIPELTNTELVNLRVRVIALENLVIALLAEATAGQRQVAREMAAVITPRAGAVKHPLTTQAATHMLDMVARAEHFCS